MDVNEDSTGDEEKCSGEDLGVGVRVSLIA
jgi:hypothetical protein